MDSDPKSLPTCEETNLCTPSSMMMTLIESEPVKSPDSVIVTSNSKDVYPATKTVSETHEQVSVAPTHLNCPED